jgi:YbgC/YbaW family acyl-CoA thioester hydrolase
VSETKTYVKLHDTDAAGLLFFSNYFKIAHTAYEKFMKSIGCGLDHIIETSDYLVPIAHAEADYERGLCLGDKFSVSLKAEIGQTSFTLSYLFKDQEGNVAARLKTVHVTVDKKSGEKIPLPQGLRHGLSAIV